PPHITRRPRRCQPQRTHTMPSRIRETLLFPLWAAARLVILLALPVALATGIALLFGVDSPLFVVVAVICGAWAIALVAMWRTQLRGRVNSISRGAIRITGHERS